jgi:hypothetical protein
MFGDEGQVAGIANRRTAMPLEHMGIIQVFAYIIAFVFD